MLKKHLNLYGQLDELEVVPTKKWYYFKYWEKNYCKSELVIYDNIKTPIYVISYADDV